MAGLYLERRRNVPAPRITFLASEIEEWAEHPGYGNLSPESARAFGHWVENVHRESEYEETLSTGELLRLCLERWIGGRPI